MINSNNSSETRQLLEFEADKKSVGLAFALWFFLGMMGAHRFYCSRGGTGAIMLVIFILSFILTFVGIGVIGFGALGIWVLIDAFQISGWVQAYNHGLISKMS